MIEITAKASELNKLIDYQEGAVVSKEIIRKDKGTVTIFAFSRGQGLSEHTAPFDALVYIFDGQAQIFIEKKPHQVKTGELIIMPANKSHALQAKTPFKMLLIMIRA